MPTITFIRHPENLVALSIVADDSACLVGTPGDIPHGLRALEEGRDVLALAHAAATGWTAPEGTETAFHDDMTGPENAALRAQCEGRVDRVRDLIDQIPFVPTPLDPETYFSRLFSRIREGVEEFDPLFDRLGHLDTKGTLVLAKDDRDAARAVAGIENAYVVSRYTPVGEVWDAFDEGQVVVLSRTQMNAEFLAIADPVRLVLTEEAYHDPDIRDLVRSKCGDWQVTTPDRAPEF